MLEESCAVEKFEIFDLLARFITLAMKVRRFEALFDVSISTKRFRTKRLTFCSQNLKKTHTVMSMTSCCVKSQTGYALGIKGTKTSSTVLIEKHRMKYMLQVSSGIFRF